MRRYLFALFVVTAPLLTLACRPAMEPRGSIDSPAVTPEVAVAFASARVALGLLDAAETTYLDSLKTPTDAQLNASSARVIKLVAIRTLLERVRQHLSGGDVEADLAQAFADLRLVVDSAKAAGLRLPPEAVKVLEVMP